MSFILDQEEKVRQLDEYMSTIGRDFMQLSLEVVKKLKEEIRIKENNSKRIQKVTSDTHQGHYDTILRRSIHPGSVIDWPFLTTQGLSRNFFDSISIDAFTRPQWYDPKRLGVSFRLGSKSRMISLLELGWRVGLYSKEQSRLTSTRSGLRRGETVKVDHALMEFWPIIGDGDFVVGGMAVKKVRDSRVRLAIVVWEDDEVEEAAGKEVGGSADVYQNMSRGDWQIDPFPRPEADYPPSGYIGYIPPGYDYRYSPALDGPH
ncbi:hypothetical protein Tco_1375419 [Tanacetum coccineum]